MWPRFIPIGAPRRARKSELLWGQLDGAPVIAKRVARPNPVWEWYRDRELAMYRAFAERPPGVRAPRLVAADGGVLILERIPGEPLATRRRPRAALPAATVAAIVAMHDALAAWSGRAPDAAPSPRVRSQLRERLLEDPTAPVEWIREGIARCARRGLVAERTARRIADALADHAPVGFGHGDLLLRNVIADRDGLAFVDWECAGSHVRDWDLALMWTQLAPAARSVIEDAVRDRGARWLAFRGLVVFALAREVRFQLAFGAGTRDRELVRCRDELAAAMARLDDGE
jgi:aminoglycoside phosphotransferase (APT) family kinase protein